MDNMENGKVVTIDGAGNPVSSSIKSNNGFLNLGLYYNFWRRFSLLAGFQQIVNKMDVSGVENTTTQHHWALGLEYKVAENMKVIGRYGQIGAKFDDSAAPTTDLDFVIQQMEVFLTVDF
jgi:hypothetical protein